MQKDTWNNMPSSNAPVKAYFMAIVKRGSEHEVAKKLRGLSGVTEVVVTYGLYDVIVRIEAPNLGQLDSLITEMRKIEEIVQTSTLVGA
jgi:DNA-binding Lrp family transcriptional regulator